MAYLRRQIKSISFILAILLPFIFTIIWLFRNTQLPGNDAANYLMTAVNIYHHFTDQGFLHGLWSLYTERGWRPIFFPVLAVPFLFVSHGNLYTAFSLIAMFYMVASAAYVYLFFRLRLDRISAIVATNLIGLLPLIQAQIVMFYAEAALFPCIIGSIYHLIKSDYLRNVKHVWGVVILLALAIMLRPVEAVTHFCFVFIFFLSIGCYRGYFSVKQILTILAVGASALFLFFSVSVLQYIHFIPVNVTDDEMINGKMAKAVLYGLIGTSILALLSWAVIIFPTISRLGHSLLLPIRGYSKSPLLIQTVFAILLLAFFWILPFAFETFQWVYRTSLGDVASNTGSLTGSHFSWNVLHIYVWAEGVMAVVTLIFVAIAGVVLLSKQQRREILLSEPFIYLLLIAQFPFWEAFYTVQIAVRKLSIAFPVLLMAMLLVGLQTGRGWLMRIISVCLLLIIFFILSMQLILTGVDQNVPSAIQNTVGSFVPRPVQMLPNPHEQVIGFLNAQVKKYKLNSIALEVNPGTSDARHYVEAEPIDPFLVSTMVVANKSNYSVSYPYFSSYVTDSIVTLGKRYDAIFLSDKASAMIVSSGAAKEYFIKYTNESNASLKVFDEILLYYSKNQLNKIGWKLGSCIVIKSVRGDDYLGCILIHI